MMWPKQHGRGRTFGALMLLVSSCIGSLAATADLAFFESKIRPLLAEHCYSCHSTKAEKLKGGLYVDSLEGQRVLF
jgi:hypothetical protein